MKGEGNMDLKLIVVFAVMVAMLVGLWMVFARLKAKNQGFGPNALRALGVVLFVPSLTVLAVTGVFSTETTAALLGTVAGYVLSVSMPEAG
jgi:hypothetical protein